MNAFAIFTGVARFVPDSASTASDGRSCQVPYSPSSD
jgi:hypothetical protein